MKRIGVLEWDMDMDIYHLYYLFGQHIPHGVRHWCIGGIEIIFFLHGSLVKELRILWKRTYCNEWTFSARVWR